MFWERTESPLEIADTRGGDWNYQVVRLSAFSKDDGGIVSIDGWTHCAASGVQGSAIAGRVVLSALKPAELRLQVALTESAELTILCNGRRAWRSVLHHDSPGHDPALHKISVNITDQKESRRESWVSIEFRFLHQAGSFWLFDDADSGLAPVVSQTPSRGYAAHAIALFAAGWLSFVSLVVVGVSLSNFLDESLFASPIAVASILLGYFGLNSFTNLPIRDGLRRLYAVGRRWPAPLAGGLSLIVCGCLLFAALACLNGSWRHYVYSNLIAEYLPKPDTALLVEAFAREPWRREARVLFERDAIGERRTLDSRRSFRTQVRELTDSSAVKTAIARVGTEPPYYLERGSAVSNPIVWFASMLPEGDSPDEFTRTFRAIELLEGRDTCGAQLHRLYLLIPLSQTLDEARESVQTLEALVRECADQPKEDVYNFQIQLAYDLLGVWYVKSDYRKATWYFNQLLTYRARQDALQRPFWRAPDKLVLFHLFRYYFEDPPIASDDPIKTNALPVLNYKIDGADEPFRAVFEREVLEREANKPYRELAGWTIDLDAEEEISSYTDSGWRF